MGATPMSDAEILFETVGRVALIRLNRPATLNALTYQMLADIRRLVREAEKDPEVTAIAFVGEGRGFCSGLDAKPVIAAVNGVAAGGGFILAMMADLRFGSESSSFTTVFSKRGLIAEHGASWLLPRLVGPSRALDLLWSSRRIESQEALRIGLLDRVAP